ncbi:hypothetical protein CHINAEXTREME_00115 [Halobiforma lacisalsi AJ5]|uniref:Uncharacterized protein n=1 Tax=Natronobacterium lacisalsi AJ5 TaxID=358396 RepID=M0LS51_NATLA|nr:hypothetical protein [Halobiforma lacisalsi]APW96260.1 hypothetical protein CHINAEXTREME_00115 [Halobiforma lacisalsi AJ5]EMA36397.1 hypothetical protein C445_03163 [Halobiforma lacisalsi AJ5]
MASLLYSIYAVAVLIVAVVGLLGVVFGTPTATEGSDYPSKIVGVLGALFVVALVGSFLL